MAYSLSGLCALYRWLIRLSRWRSTRCYGPTAANRRMRFVIDFAYATGLNASGLVRAPLGLIEDNAKDDSNP